MVRAPLILSLRIKASADVDVPVLTLALNARSLRVSAIRGEALVADLDMRLVVLSPQRLYSSSTPAPLYEMM